MLQVALAALLALPAAVGEPQTGGPPPEEPLVAGTGIVVEEVEGEFSAQGPGLKPGDVLLDWKRAASPPANPEPAAGTFDSPFDLLVVRIEEAPRGELVLTGMREGVPLQVRVPAGPWRLETRPRLRGVALATYNQASALLAAGELEAGQSLWRETASLLENAGGPLAAAWLHLRAANRWSGDRNWERAESAFAEAQRRVRSAGQLSFLARVTQSLANSRLSRGELEPAASAHQEALEILLKDPSTRLGASVSLVGLGTVEYRRGDLQAAETYLRRALALREELAPGSLGLARNLNNLGLVVLNRGALAEAEHYLRRSLALKEGLAPGSLDIAMSLNNLGGVSQARGDLASAEDFFRRSLRIRERHAPGSFDVAMSLNNLGIVAMDRGNLAAADSFFRRSHGIFETIGAASLDVAMSLNNLGNLAGQRGDLKAAEELFRRSLAIHERRAPNSLLVAGGLTNLGHLALLRADLAAADNALRQALTLYERLAPGGITMAEPLGLLGDVAVASSDLDSAEELYERSLAISRERAPGSATEAASCRRLAHLHRKRNQHEEALASFRCAVAALETQRGKLGGSDRTRTGFGARHSLYYKEAIDLLVEVGEEKEAFLLLERYRARELLTLLAERDLVFAADLPTDLEERRRTADWDYDRALERWMQLSDRASTEEVQAARGTLDEIRRRQEELRAEIRLASPRLSALQDPQPLGVEATTAALDPGTLVLSYSVGVERSHLFAVGPEAGRFEVLPLAVGEESLRTAAEGLRSALRRGQFEASQERLTFLASRLTEQLLTPAAAQIHRAERLLILADGPLHALPFAALADPRTPDGGRFLAEAKPIHLAASATVFALLKRLRLEGRETQIVAFGDPRYPAKGTAPELDGALRAGIDLTPLPATRSEVEAIRALYPERSRIYLGENATEGRVKDVGPEATHIHIASHGLLDDRFPLDSAVAFSIPTRWQEGEDNGLLQAWEVFEQLRIDADLVTLSACDTGRGKVSGGEGLLGLTRAFQYAGARSVLASLWSVSDRSTGKLMQRFYGYLKQGQSKAEALRRAQLELLGQSSSSHPFHWAGFQLVGDWR